MNRKIEQTRAEQTDPKDLTEDQWARLDAFAYILHLATDHRELHTCADCIVSLFSIMQHTGWINNPEEELR